MPDTTTTALALRQDAAALIPYGDLERMAVAIAKSNLFGMKTPEQALVLMLLAQAEGMHPVTAARDYHIIEGRPSLKADSMLARHLGSGGSVKWHTLSETEVSATFSHPKGGDAKIVWTIDMAKRAGLAQKANWQKYPRSMLRSRVISEGVRTVNPGAISRIYTPEEIQDGDFADDETPTTGAAAGASHLEEQWGAAEGQPAEPAAKVTVEVQPTGTTEAKPPTRKQHVKAVALDLGLMPDQITACLFKLGWPTAPGDLSEEQFEALCSTHLQEWAKNPGPREADWE